MASIPLPALDVKPPNIDPAAGIRNAYAIRGMQQQQQMGSIELQNAQQDQKDRQTISKLFQQNSGDLDQTIKAAAAAGVQPKTLVGLQSQSVDMKTKMAGLTKDQLGNFSAVHDNAAGLIQPVLDATTPEMKDAAYQAGLKKIYANPTMYGITDANQIPAVRPPDETLKTQLALNMGQKEQAAQTMKQREVAAQELAAQNRGGPEMDAYNANKAAALLAPQFNQPANAFTAAPQGAPNTSGQPPNSSAATQPQATPANALAAGPQPQAQSAPINPPATDVAPQSVLVNPPSTVGNQTAQPASGAGGTSQNGNLYSQDEAAFKARAAAQAKAAAANQALQQTYEIKNSVGKNGPLAPDKIDNLNKTLADRYQVLNPGKTLPPQYVLPPNAKAQDYATVDKALEQVEHAQGVKAQQDTANAMRTQAAATSQAAAADRSDKLGREPVVGQDKDGNTVLVSAADAKTMGLTGQMKADTDLVNKAQAGRDWLKLATNQAPTDATPDKMGIMQLVDKMDKEGKLGTVTSRWEDFMAGKVGAGDPEFAALRAKMGLSTTKLMQAHVGSRGGAFMLEHFEDLANAGKMNAPTLKSALASEVDYVKDVAKMPQPSSGPAKNGASATLPPQAASQLQEGHNTTFANGQIWTKTNGQPVQVK